MATLPGGIQVASVGLTSTELTTVSDILQTNFATAPAPVTETIVRDETKVVQTEVLVGTFAATSVQNQTVTASGSGGLAVVNTDNSGTSSGNSITNLVADNNVGGIVLGGAGNSSTITGIIFDSGSKTSTVIGNAGTQLIDGSRSTVNMTIVTGTGNDTVVSGAGNDRVTFGDVGIANGGGGADTLIGGTGTATLGGGAGADSIVAATGGGILIGEVGDDTMVGGDGNDVFIYRGGDGSDVINGFNPASDTLALAVSGVDIMSVINNATVSGGNTIITMADGSTITLAGVTGINVNWFTVK